MRFYQVPIGLVTSQVSDVTGLAEKLLNMLTHRALQTSTAVVPDYRDDWDTAKAAYMTQRHERERHSPRSVSTATRARLNVCVCTCGETRSGDSDDRDSKRDNIHTRDRCSQHRLRREIVHDVMYAARWQLLPGKMTIHINHINVQADKDGIF